MPRPSKLSTTQCDRIRALKTDPTNPVSAPALAKRYHVSESSIYKVLDGSYVARQPSTPTERCGTTARSVPAQKPLGAMPSIFHPMRRAGDHPHPHVPDLSELLNQAAKQDLGPVDELTLAAAELVLARAKLSRMLAAA